MNPALPKPRQAKLSSRGDLQVLTSGETGEESVLDILRSIQSDRKEIKRDLGGVSKSIDELKEEHNLLVQQNEELTERVKSLETECTNLRSQSTRNNVIFYGIEEVANETGSDCEKRFVNLCLLN